ncbi:MAG: PhoH family protein [Candidatus Rifleibacteriota bacterium]
MNFHEEQFELDEELSRHILGTAQDNGLALICSLPEVTARARGNRLYVEGSEEKIELVKRFLQILQSKIASREKLDPFELKRLFEQYTTPQYADKILMGQNGRAKLFPEIIQANSGRSIRPKTYMQQSYVEAMEKNIITIARGPAGTGKTYLATAMAIRALKEKKVSRVVLSRPVVEAGESLGYLPGDVKEKVDPHFKPLYDSIQEFIGTGKFEQFLRQGIIEITPLAYMRGRTFNEAFVVLDEAQNTTVAQMRMALTRLGYGSKMVITGDHTQIDLPEIKDSSMLYLNAILGKVEFVSFIDLTDRDVIRHEIVSRIIRAFDTYLNRNKKKP